jgi:phosphoenolpyruvate-protein phosphotransferase (PTS system enzyme I)
MSFTIHGIGVSGGIAIGHAHLVSHTKLEVAHYDIPAGQVADESSRFDAAVKTVRDELEQLRSTVPAGAPAEFGAFIDLHLMILADSTLSEAPRTIIETSSAMPNGH